MRITMIGHSTVLMETGGLRILTDPYFGSWGNPAYARLRPAWRARHDFREVDVVLVSHNHWDHTDRRFFASIKRDVPVLAPKRSAWVTRLKGARHVVGMKPWAAWTKGTVTVHAVPALHMATTIGFVIQSDGTTAYFAGDTYYRPFMAEIGRRFRLDVALMPVTTYRVPMTMSEKSAVRAVADLRVPVVLPIHLALQPRSPLLRTRQTPQGFARRLAAVHPSTEVVILGEGESWQGDNVARSIER